MNKLLNLSKCGISEETIKKLGVFENEDKDIIFGVQDEIQSRSGNIILKKNGEVVEPTFEYAMPFESHFNAKAKDIVITDSLLDMLTIAQCFKYSKTVYFVPSEECLRNYCTLIPNIKRVSIINNKKTYLNNAYKYFKPEILVNVKVPTQKSINAIYLQKDYALINNLLEGKDLQDGLNLVDIDTMLEKGLQLESSKNNFPFNCLNKALGGVKKNEICIILAGSAGGKTDFAFRMLDQFIKDGDKVGVFAMEQKYQHEVLFQMASFRGKFKYDVNEVIENGNDPKSPEMQKYLSHIIGFKDQIAIFDTTKVNLTIENIENYIRNFVRVEGVKHIMIDHITFFAHKAGAKGLDQVGQFVSKLVELSQELSCTFIVTTQAHKLGGKGQDAENGVQLSVGDIFGSSAINHAATLILALERNSLSDDEEIRNTTNCRVLKSRYDPSQMGKSFELWYDVETGQKIDKEERANYQAEIAYRKQTESVPF